MGKASIIFLLGIFFCSDSFAQDGLQQKEIQLHFDTLVFDFSEAININILDLGNSDLTYFTMPIYTPKTGLPARIVILDTAGYHHLLKPILKPAESEILRSTEDY